LVLKRAINCRGEDWTEERMGGGETATKRDRAGPNEKRQPHRGAENVKRKRRARREVKVS